MRYFACLLLELSIHLFFFPILLSSYCSVKPCVVFVRWNQSFFTLFLCSLWIVVSMRQLCLQCQRFSFLLIFFYAYSLCHLSDVSPYSSSLVFLFSRSFVEVLLSSTPRMVTSILKGGKPRCLSFWWDFCCRVWFWVVFSFSWDTLFKFFLPSPLH